MKMRVASKRVRFAVVSEAQTVISCRRQAQELEVLEANAKESIGHLMYNK
jgi:hypothetical protein